MTLSEPFDGRLSFERHTLEDWVRHASGSLHMLRNDCTQNSYKRFRGCFLSGLAVIISWNELYEGSLCFQDSECECVHVPSNSQLYVDLLVRVVLGSHLSVRSRHLLLRGVRSYPQQFVILPLTHKFSLYHLQLQKIVSCQAQR